MKKILGFLATFAALTLFVAPSYAGSHEGGTIRRISGFTFSLGSGLSTTTTYDIWKIGFQAKWVQLCGEAAGISRVYIRLSEDVTNEATNATSNIAPTSSSTAFIVGTKNGVLERAIPFTLASTTVGAQPTFNMVRCETNPWRTRGLVIHNVSGVATLDARAW